MTVITRDTITNDLEIEVLGSKAKSIMKKALIKAFGKDHGEYLAEYGVVNTGNNRVYIVVNQVESKELKDALLEV